MLEQWLEELIILFELTLLMLRSPSRSRESLNLKECNPPIDRLQPPFEYLDYITLAWNIMRCGLIIEVAINPLILRTRRYILFHITYEISQDAHYFPNL